MNAFTNLRMDTVSDLSFIYSNSRFSPGIAWRCHIHLERLNLEASCGQYLYNTTVSLTLEVTAYVAFIQGVESIFINRD